MFNLGAKRLKNKEELLVNKYWKPETSFFKKDVICASAIEYFLTSSLFLTFKA
jgi:hypothetical protein